MRYLYVVRPLAIVLAASACRTSFQWPDSNNYARVLVNVNEHIESRPPAWFAQDRLVTDLAVSDPTPQGHAAAVERCERVRRLLESRGIAVGTYVSGTTVAPKAAQTRYPPSMVSLETMPAHARYLGSWPGQPRRRIVDLSDAATRHALQAEIKRLWRQSPAPVRFVDNAAVHPSAGRGQAWGNYCANIRELRLLAESLGSKAIFNVSLHVGVLSDTDALQLIDAVGGGGLALEMPWHPYVQQRESESTKAKQRYRQLLDSGMAIVMIPVKTDAHALVSWVRTWRRPADHVYVSGRFWKQPDAFLYRPGR